MEGNLQFTGGSGSVVPVRYEDVEPNPLMDGLDATLGARQEYLFSEFLADWVNAINSSVSLGSLKSPPARTQPSIGRETNHSAALEVLESVLADDRPDDKKKWEVLKQELQKDRTSSRKLFKCS